MLDILVTVVTCSACGLGLWFYSKCVDSTQDCWAERVQARGAMVLEEAEVQIVSPLHPLHHFHGTPIRGRGPRGRRVTRMQSAGVQGEGMQGEGMGDRGVGGESGGSEQTGDVALPGELVPGELVHVTTPEPGHGHGHGHGSESEVQYDMDDLGIDDLGDMGDVGMGDMYPYPPIPVAKLVSMNSIDVSLSSDLYYTRDSDDHVQVHSVEA
jgi:hypothetical protein